jgi:uncharacterized protein YbjT (DUF2867 family)
MKILIAGSSGFCGQAVIRALATHKEYQVIAHLRAYSSRTQIMQDLCNPLSVEILQVDWDDITTHLQKIQPHVLISFIGTTKKQLKVHGGSYDEIDYGLNQILIDYADSQIVKPCMIYLSSMGLAWASMSPYLQARVKVEASLKQSDLSYAIIRPGLLSGDSRDESRPMEHMSASFSHMCARGLRGIGAKSMADAMQPLDAPDVAQFVLYLLRDYQKYQSQSEQSVEQPNTEKNQASLWRVIHELPTIHKILRAV